MLHRWASSANNVWMCLFKFCRDSNGEEYNSAALETTNFREHWATLSFFRRFKCFRGFLKRMSWLNKRTLQMLWIGDSLLATQPTKEVSVTCSSSCAPAFPTVLCWISLVYCVCVCGAKKKCTRRFRQGMVRAKFPFHWAILWNF